QKLSVTKNKRTGEGCGTIRGVQESVNMVSRFMVVCTNTSGQMARKNVWNLRIIRSRNISGNPFPLTHPGKYFLIISRAVLKKVTRAISSSLTRWHVGLIL